MNGWLIWHPESYCLFREFDPEKLDSHLSQGAEDVTGLSEYESKFAMQAKIQEELEMEFKFGVFQPEHDVFHREAVKRQLFSSCINCIEWSNKDSFKGCMKYKMMPPPEVIVFSCGANWEGDLPF